jgi:uncharacterized protein
MTGVTRRILAIVAVWVWFGGCATFAPRADPSSFYVLGALPEADLRVEISTAGVNANFTAGLGIIELPGYLDRQQIVTRTSNNRLSYSENDRWATPLAESFSRVLGQNISHLLKPAPMIQFPWQSTDVPDYQVKIEVIQFEANGDQNAWLTARWSVIDRNKKILVSQRSHLNRRAASSATEDFVKALSATLGDLSREIVNTLLSFEQREKI